MTTNADPVLAAVWDELSHQFPELAAVLLRDMPNVPRYVVLIPPDVDVLDNEHVLDAAWRIMVGETPAEGWLPVGDNGAAFLPLGIG